MRVNQLPLFSRAASAGISREKASDGHRYIKPEPTFLNLCRIQKSIIYVLNVYFIYVTYITI